MTRIAISMGDPAGIGPEITVRALQAAALDASAITVYGSARVFAELEAQLGLTLPEGTTLRDCDDELPAEPSAGARQVRALERAVDAVLAGEADALCTAPIPSESGLPRRKGCCAPPTAVSVSVCA